MVDFSFITTFVTEARQETSVLASNGAACQAEARTRLLQQLQDAVTAIGTETVSVEEAAEMAEVSEETVRRAARRGEFVDTRTSNKQSIRVPKSFLPTLAAKKRRKAATDELVSVARPTADTSVLDKFNL